MFAPSFFTAVRGLFLRTFTFASESICCVIFMATLPLAQRSIDTDLPAHTARGNIPGVSPLVLDYTVDRQISINQQPVVLGELQERHTTVY